MNTWRSAIRASPYTPPLVRVVADGVRHPVRTVDRDRESVDGARVARGSQDGERIGMAQYLVPQGQAFDKAFELAVRVAENAPLTNYALMHALPRIAEQPADHGFLTEAMMAAIAQSAPPAKERVRAFLEGRAAKVKKS